MSPQRTVLLFSAIAVVVAILRMFTKALLEPIGIPTIVGSLLESVTIVTIAGIVTLFVGEARNKDGRYARALGYSLLLALWCEVLIISGIIATETLGMDTYYTGPWEQVHAMFPTAREHAIGHMQGFIFRFAAYVIIASIVYAIVRRRRVHRSAGI